MDAIFVNPRPEGIGLNEATVEPPLGLAYLASLSEQQGFTCSIVDANALHLGPPEVMRVIPKGVKLIGFYINSYSYDAVLKLTALCQNEYPDAVVLLGGPLASASPHQLLDEFPCHGLVRGEGEYAVLQIMENISRGSQPLDAEVPGAAFRDPESGEIVLNPVVRIKDLDRLPFPAYHLLPPLNVYKSRLRKSPIAGIITSRGCPYQCIFCSKDVFQRQVTFRSAANVLAEIDYLADHFGVRQIDVLDDNFTLKRSRVEEILDGLIEREYGLALNLQSGIRTENVDEALLRKMKRAGFYKLAFGIESADPEVLRICRKHLNLKRVEELIRVAKKMDFLVYGFFIIGLPGESEDTFQRTLDFAKRMDFDVANFCMAVPFVGTELYRMIKDKGRFLIDTTRNIDMGFYGGEVFFEHGQLKAKDVQRRYKTAYREFYNLRRRLKMLTKIRSLEELRWHINAAYFVLKGIRQA